MRTRAGNFVSVRCGAGHQQSLPSFSRVQYLGLGMSSRRAADLAVTVFTVHIQVASQDGCRSDYQ
eukprot:35614-Eustigmatos_ZCMA.PRE.1